MNTLVLHMLLLGVCQCVHVSGAVMDTYVCLVTTGIVYHSGYICVVSWVYTCVHVCDVKGVHL